MGSKSEAHLYESEASRRNAGIERVSLEKIYEIVGDVQDTHRNYAQSSRQSVVQRCIGDPRTVVLVKSWRAHVRREGTGLFDVGGRHSKGQSTVMEQAQANWHPDAFQVDDALGTGLDLGALDLFVLALQSSRSAPSRECSLCRGKRSVQIGKSGRLTPREIPVEIV